ncbi:MAG: hypothetical protein JXB50_16680 [Spirochaetes bacterium]|nr:hypothetical protein [Spirochaetota bacterium]
MDDLWLENEDGALMTESYPSGQLIINSDDTYYIDMKFKKPSGFTQEYAPFYCETIDETNVHIKEHSVLSCKDNYFYFNPSKGKKWKTYIYYFWKNGILLEISDRDKNPWFDLKKIF